MAWKGRGNNKVQCDRTGAIVHASDCRLTWDGLFVLKSAWYPRQPQDTNSPIREGTPPAISRPVGEPEFIDPVTLKAESTSTPSTWDAGTWDDPDREWL
jgi:hypothetical protein